MAEATSSLPSHPVFKFPRVPANRFVELHWRINNRPARDFEGLFVTSGFKDAGSEHEVYILRRVAAPDAPPEFLEIPRRWQENGAMTVFDIKPDLTYVPPKAA